MAGNHYSRQVLELEAVLQEKLHQLTTLEQEHQALVHKEHALKSAIKGTLAIKEALVLDCSGAAAAEHSSDTQPRAKSQPASTDISTVSGHSSAHSSLQGGKHPTPDRQPRSSTQGLDNPPRTSHPASADLPHDVVERLKENEARVQSLMQELGCPASSWQQLYTTQLLHRALADPQHIAGYLFTPKLQRLEYLAETNARMALLLSKYDLPTQRSLGAWQQLDDCVDDLQERLIVCGILDPPTRYLNNLMVNLDTHEFQPYPEGWWKLVVQVS